MQCDKSSMPAEAIKCSRDSVRSTKVRHLDWSSCLYMCHCIYTGSGSGLLTAFSEVSWVRLKEVASVRDETRKFVGSLWDDGTRGFYHRECYTLFLVP